MVTLSSKFFNCTFIFILLISCTNTFNKEQRSEVQLEKQASQFYYSLEDLEKKFSLDFLLRQDSISLDIYVTCTYLDCEKEGYFTILFIPKTTPTKEFWKQEFLRSNLNKTGVTKLTPKANVFLRGNLKDYYIICYRIENDNMNMLGGCSVEEVSLDGFVNADIFIYAPSSESWSKIKQFKTVRLPPFIDKQFLSDSLPALFPPKFTLQDSNWYGTYRLNVDCGVRYGNRAEWTLEVAIRKDVIRAKGVGYEADFLISLIPKEVGGSLYLYRAQSSNFTDTLSNQNPMFILKRDGAKFYVESELLRTDDVMLEPEALGFSIEKYFRVYEIS